jgi:hypothetical protein
VGHGIVLLEVTICFSSANSLKMVSQLSGQWWQFYISLKNMSPMILHALLTFKIMLRNFRNCMVIFVTLMPVSGRLHSHFI